MAFRLAVRAILGQQVSVERCDDPGGPLGRGHSANGLATPYPQLNRLTPTVHANGLGRAEEIGALASSVPVREALRCSHGDSREKNRIDLRAERRRSDRSADEPAGHRPWTAQYIAMRALHWPGCLSSGATSCCLAGRECDTEAACDCVHSLAAVAFVRNSLFMAVIRSEIHEQFLSCRKSHRALAAHVGRTALTRSFIWSRAARRNPPTVGSRMPR